MPTYHVPCIAERKLFPADKDNEINFMLCSYRASSLDSLPAGAADTRFIAKGMLLPYSTTSQITLIGDKWEKKGDEYTLHCVGYEEIIPNTPVGVSGFLEAQGCDKKDIARILNTAPEGNPIGVLANDGAYIRSAIKNSHQARTLWENISLRREKRDVFFYVLPFLPKGTNVQVAVDVAIHSKDILDVQHNPFSFSINGLLPYRAAKAVAKQNGIDCRCMEGVEAAIVDVLMQSEGKTAGKAFDDDAAVGNTFVPCSDAICKAANILGMDKATPVLSQAVNRLVEDGYCVIEGDALYRAETYAAEKGIADEILRLLSAPVSTRDYSRDIMALENRKAMRVAPEQRSAVKTALANPVTLLIGGPGTGKTTIEQFIMEIYRLYHDAPVLLVAPTGKAARRMSEATGESAQTIHKALGVSAGTEVIISDVVLDAGLILVDEASMLDTQVAYALLKAIKEGTQVVLVGDTDQLPSVGPGNVLFELINSGVLPVAGLITPYRAAAGSLIANNCARIKRGATELEYAETFMFVPADSQEDAVEKVLAIYRSEIASGVRIEDICLLSPYRRSTLTGVNSLNTRIQDELFGSNMPSVTYGDKRFCLGAKVMMMANKKDVANGDIGYIRAISEDGKRFDVQYEDGQTLSYRKSDLRDFELAYGISIHKSQGSEAQVCIIVLMDEHKAMLKRNLVYTAVSRAKRKVYIVGTEQALCTAILTEDVSKRQSRLSVMLRDEAQQ